jgi:hypothetical protein
MEYTANDADVTPFLEELNAFVFVLGSQVDTGAKNLKKILSVVKSDLIKQRYNEQDKLARLIERKLIVDKGIDSLGDNKFAIEQLESRYTTYKTQLQSMSNTSLFMNIVNRVTDSNFAIGIKQLENLRRESSELNLLISYIENEVQYFKDLDEQLQILETKINSL